MYCVTKQQIDNQFCSWSGDTILLHELSADRKLKIIEENNNVCFEPPMNSKITASLLKRTVISF